METSVKVGTNVNVGNNVSIDRSQKGTVGFTCGAFDLLHTGHALMLEEAKEQCDWLIVAVQSDPSIDRETKNKPIQEYEERVAMVEAIRYVDEVLLYETEEELVELLKAVNPDVRIVGADWQGKPFTGSDLPTKVFFNSRNHSYSTSSLRRRVYQAEKHKIDQERRQNFINSSFAQIDARDVKGF